jgi:hypothetical protein
LGALLMPPFPFPSHSTHPHSDEFIKKPEALNSE